jgi:ribosome-associated toxin RatA of RatAB toxin-antitoxin module
VARPELTPDLEEFERFRSRIVKSLEGAFPALQILKRHQLDGVFRALNSMWRFTPLKAMLGNWTHNRSTSQR